MRWLWLAAFCTFGAQTASASSSTDFYELTICNEHWQKVYVALSWYDQPNWVVEGWWPVEAGRCEVFGNFPKGSPFYSHAQAEDGSYWGSGALSLCVSRGEPFRRINSDNYTCGYDEELKPFTRKDVQADLFTLRLN